jgi:broad specificity phosphatase PhoE
MELLLIRHGRSLGDDLNRIEGAGWDAPLTEVGLAQATLLAQRLAGEGFRADILFSSPLARARRTAEVIATALAIAPVLDQRLAELHTGVLGGLTREQANALIPEPAGGHRSYVRIPKGESKIDHLGRVLAFYSELVDKHMEKRVCVVAHGGTLSALLQVIYALPLWSPYQDPRFGFRTGDTGVHRLTIQPGRVVTHFLNDTAHLRSPGTES